MSSPGINVGDVVQGRIWTADSEQAAVNTVYFKCTSTAGAGASVQDFVDALDAGVGGDMKGLIANTAKYQGCQARNITLLPLSVMDVAIANAGVGTAGAIGLPRQTAGTISWRTDTAGPGYRGRIYLPFAAAADNQTLGIPTASYQTRALALATLLINYTTCGTGGNTSTFHLVVHSRKHATNTPVTNAIVELEWATMKKRGSYGRPNVSPI